MEKAYHAASFLIVLFTGLSCNVFAENQCSKFECEYKVLERLIYLENKNSDLEKKQEMLERKNDDLMEVVKEQRIEMEERDNELVEGQKKLKTDIDATGVARDTLRKEITHEQGEARRMMNSTLAGMIERMETETLPAIGFSVTQRSVHQKYSAGQTVVFNNVLTNDDNAYDAITGVFSAPRNGQYFFAMSIFTFNGQVWMQLMKNDERIGRIQADARAGGSYHDTASTTAVVSLVKGDRVYMKFEKGAGSWDWDVHGGLHNQFSGFLIR